MSKWHVTPRILRIHSHREALSAASKMFVVAFFNCSPFTPRSLTVRSSERPAKPRHPTSTASQRAFQPLFRHSELSSAYLALLRSWTSSIRSSQRTVSSRITTCLVNSDVSTMSGRREVAVMLPGNLSCLTRST